MTSLVLVVVALVVGFVGGFVSSYLFFRQNKEKKALVDDVVTKVSK